MDTNFEVRYQALLNLSKRGRGGIFIYPIVWFITAVWVDMPAITPTEFALFTFSLITISILRSIHLILLRKYSKTHTDLMYKTLVALILSIGFTWGVLSSWVMVFSPYPELKYPFMVILSAVAMGGTTVLSISRIIGTWYPFLIFGPSLLLFIYGGDAEDLVMVLLAFLAIIYVIDAAKTTRKDYEAAITNRLLADDRSQQLQEISITDELTGLKNRKYLNEQLLEQWKRCVKQQQTIAILMYDIDHFKSINDRYGHIEGDRCLVTIANMLSNVVNHPDYVVARYGGEEFIIVLPNTNIEEATNLAKALVAATQEIKFIVKGELVKITSSVGVASSIPNGNEPSEKLIYSADKALYRAKSEGRNRYCNAN